jgi:hypothetical protein
MLWREIKAIKGSQKAGTEETTSVMNGIGDDNIKVNRYC